MRPIQCIKLVDRSTPLRFDCWNGNDRPGRRREKKKTTASERTTNWERERAKRREANALNATFPTESRTTLCAILFARCTSVVGTVGQWPTNCGKRCELVSRNIIDNWIAKVFTPKKKNEKNRNYKSNFEEIKLTRQSRFSIVCVCVCTYASTYVLLSTCWGWKYICSWVLFWTDWDNYEDLLVYRILPLEY